VVAFLFLLPYVLWEVSNGWPTLEFWSNYGEKIDAASPLEFLVEQIVTMQPPTLPLWLAGLLYYLFSGGARSYRALGWVYVILFVIFLLQNARFYFLAPAYPMLFAAGAVVFECFVNQLNRGWIKSAFVMVLAVSGFVVAPLTVLPALPVETLAKITGAVGGDAGVQVETREVGQLPQIFADRFGWENMVADVAELRGGAQNPGCQAPLVLPDASRGGDGQRHVRDHEPGLCHRHAEEHDHQSVLGRQARCHHHQSGR